MLWLLMCLDLPNALIQAIQGCLEDYTTDSRGDVGSLVRIEAIDTVLLAWESGTLNLTSGRELFARIVGLAAEKLDKVRSRAWQCLCTIYEADQDIANFGLDV